MTAVAIIGCGLIGQSWALAFARGGCTVRLFDPTPGVLDGVPPAVEELMDGLMQLGLMRQQRPDEIRARISYSRDLRSALDGAAYVQESTPEDLAIKRGVFRDLDRYAPSDAVIASSTSALLASQFTEGLAGAHRCLVAHPLNPPHLIPAVELVPGPQTGTRAVEGACALMRMIGQRPLVLNREIEGFVMNRLQGAVLDEAFRLLADGVASVSDIDTAMRDGLALRWSFMGPFETIDLNAPGGIADFMARYGPAYAASGRERPGRAAWDAALAALVTAARRGALPEPDLAARRTWRDRRLGALAAHKARSDDRFGVWTAT